MPYVSVAIDVPLRTAFDYRAEGVVLEDIGRRVLVSFGPRRVIGVILGVTEHTTVSQNRVKPVLKVYAEDRLSSDDIGLLHFAAEYYQTPIGEAVMSALPARLRSTRPQKQAAGGFRLTAAGAAADTDSLKKRSPVMAALLDALRARGTMLAPELAALAPSAAASVRKLITRGWLERCDLPDEPAESLSSYNTIHVPVTLTAEQQSAVDRIAARLGTFHPVLLHGVTGSGKTEVYLRVIAQTIAQGRQALVLVPEIGLTPQLLQMVRARFPEVVIAHLHSALGEGERLRHWRAAASGHARIVLGTRLAVFVPLPAPGIIIVDEEHDASFKQNEGFRYSARDLAVLRARRSAIPVVLGSATPSLETYHNAQTGRYERIVLPKRFGVEPPRIRCIDTRALPLRDGLTPELVGAIGQRLARREQSMVFINRRGYAPVLMCPSCRWLSGCHRCSAQMVLHLEARRLRCHHCGADEPVPVVCPDCGNADIAPVGQGTQRIESALSAAFPEARVLRIDRDSTRRKNEWDTMRERIHRGDVDILVGTQMLAKGHDFPLLGLVGVVNSDASLYSADFRASERLYALLAQVAGRAGRREKQGEVLIQTSFPDHPLYEALSRHVTDDFADVLLNERRQAGFPPFVHQALLRAEAPRLEIALAFLDNAATEGRALSPDVYMYDPVPAPMVRLAGRERAQLLVQCSSRGALQRFLKTWISTLEQPSSTAARWTIDVDPAEF